MLNYICIETNPILGIRMELCQFETEEEARKQIIKTYDNYHIMNDITWQFLGEGYNCDNIVNIEKKLMVL